MVKRAPVNVRYLWLFGDSRRTGSWLGRVRHGRQIHGNSRTVDPSDV
jgi:hypothetical protein